MGKKCWVFYTIPSFGHQVVLLIQSELVFGGVGLGGFGVGKIYKQSINAESTHKLDVHNWLYCEFTYHLPLNVTSIKTEEKTNSHTLILVIKSTILPQENNYLYIQFVSNFILSGCAAMKIITQF